MAHKFGKIWRVITALVVFYPLFLYAQPRGDEPDTIRQIVKEINRKIAEKTSEIDKQPKAARLYGERAALYVELYQKLYHGYYSKFYGEKPPELSVSVITSKAVSDFSKAIRISPEPLYYGERGEMYSVRWNDTVSKINWYEELQWIPDPEWKDIVPPEREKNELKILDKIMRNPDFAAARSDYEKALAAAVDSKTREKFHEKLARLYLSRSSRIAGNLQYHKNLVVEPNIYGYSLFKDLDKGIAELEKSNCTGDYNMMYPLPTTWFLESLPPLRHALYGKANILSEYGKNALALQTLNAAEKDADKNKPYDYFTCHFYTFRSRLNTLNGKFDAAIADANRLYVYGNDAPRPCFGAYEPRGDAYFAKNDFQAALADYSLQITEANYSPVDVPRLRQKRALAYLKLGEFKNAITDLSYSMGYIYKPELYLLRAQAQRGLNDEKNALDDEKRAAEIAENLNPKTRKSGIYGKVTMADGKPVTRENVQIIFIYTDGDKQQWSPSVDEKGRFSFYPRKPLPFSLFVYFDTVKDGVAVRYYARTAALNPQGKLDGPLIIKLERFVRRTTEKDTK